LGLIRALADLQAHSVPWPTPGPPGGEETRRGAIGPKQTPSRKALTYNTPQRPGASALVPIGTGDDNGPQEASNIAHDRACAPLDPCGPLAACVPASRGPLHRVRIATGGTGLTVSACKDAPSTAYDLMPRRLGARTTPRAQRGRDEAVRRHSMRPRTPGHAAANNREKPVAPLACGRGVGATARLCLREQWWKKLPLFRMEISGIEFLGWHTASVSQQTSPLPNFFDTL
jgi:hypothetical protein